MKFRKKPVVIEAVQWLGGVDRGGTSKTWMPADLLKLADAASEETGVKSLLRHAPGAPENERLMVWNTAEKQWIRVPLGNWVAKGVLGELYPIAPDVLATSFEIVEEDTK